MAQGHGQIWPNDEHHSSEALATSNNVEVNYAGSSAYTDAELAEITAKLRQHLIHAINEQTACRCGKIEALQFSEQPEEIALDVDGAPWFLTIRFS